MNNILAAEEILQEEINYKMALTPDERSAILNAFERFAQQIKENVNQININELLKIKKN